MKDVEMVKKFENKITEFGKHVFWGKTITKASVIIDVQRRARIFCGYGLNMGVTIGRPEMCVIENTVGISEYGSTKKNWHSSTINWQKKSCYV